MILQLQLTSLIPGLFDPLSQPFILRRRLTTLIDPVLESILPLRLDER
jgi:hypothetical protein